MGGIHLQIETMFDQVPFVAPCRGANSPTTPEARNGSVPLFNPVPLPLPCPCAPCEDLPSPDSPPLFVACQCDPNPFISCVAPNSVNFSGSFLVADIGDRAYRIFVPMPQDQPLESVAIWLHFLEGDGSLKVTRGDQGAASFEAPFVGDEWMILCQDQLLEAPLLILEIFPVAHFSIVRLRFQLTVLLNQPILPAYLFAPVAPLHASLVCLGDAAMPATRIPLLQLPSVSDGALYLAGWRSIGIFGPSGSNFTVMVGQSVISNKLNFYFHLSDRGFNVTRGWPFYNIPLFDWFPEIPAPPVSEPPVTVSLQSCHIAFETPLVDQYGRQPLAATQQLISRERDCRFAEMQLVLPDSQEGCSNYACLYGSFLHQTLSVETLEPQPHIGNLFEWTISRTMYPWMASLMLVSSKPFHTCRASFWDDFVSPGLVNVTHFDSVCHINNYFTEAWLSDPCCNSALEQCCLPRNTTVSEIQWSSNLATQAERCPSSCLPSFIDPVVQAFPNPSTCDLSPMLLVGTSLTTISDLVAGEPAMHFCTSHILNSPCSTDSDCHNSLQFCHPFIGECVFPCATDEECLADPAYRMATNSSWCNVGAGFCQLNSSSFTAENIHDSFSFCLFESLGDALDLFQIPILDQYQELDRYKLLSLLLPPHAPQPITPEVVLDNADRIIFPPGCFGPGHPSTTPQDCLETPICNWGLGRCPTYPPGTPSPLYSECLTACELPISRPSPFMCNLCQLSVFGLTCNEVSRWAGCVSPQLSRDECYAYSSLGAGWDHFAAVCYLPAPNATECPPGFDWQDDFLNTEEECLSPARFACSDASCGDDCTEERCVTQHGRCAFKEQIPVEVEETLGVCFVMPIFLAQTRRFCPLGSVNSYIGCVMIESSIEECALHVGSIWFDLTDRESCLSLTFCPDTTGRQMFLSEESCHACGSAPEQGMVWWPARWVSSENAYQWSSREYSTTQNQWVPRLDPDAFRQVSLSASILPVLRSMQLLNSCYYGRHFSLFSLTGCACIPEALANDTQIWTDTLANSQVCFETNQFPFVMQSLPVCSHLKPGYDWVFPIGANLTTIDTIGFVVSSHWVPVLDPSLGQLCADLTFIARMVKSEATIISETGVNSYGRAILYDIASDDPLYQAYNDHNVRVGVLDGNGINFFAQPDLRFVEPLEICLVTIELDSSRPLDPRFSYQTGCYEDPSKGKSGHGFSISAESHLNQIDARFVCFPIDGPTSQFPCSILPGSQNLGYFLILSIDQKISLLSCVLAYGIAFLGSLVLFAYIFSPKHPALNTSLMIVMISALFLLLRLLFFILVMNGKLDAGDVVEVFLSLTPTVIFFSLISVLLAKWLALGYLAPTGSRETVRRLPRKFLIPISLVNLVLYILLMVVIISSIVMPPNGGNTICVGHDSSKSWVYYFVFVFRVILAVFAASIIVGCTLAGVRIYRVLKNALPNRAATRRLWLFFALIGCALVSIVGQTVLLLLFFATPDQITLTLAVISSLLIELAPVVALLILLFIARRSKFPTTSRRSLLDLCMGKEDKKVYSQGSEMGLLADDELNQDLATDDLGSESTFTTQSDWSVN